MEINTLKLPTKYGDTQDVCFRVGKYINGGNNTAIQMFTTSDGYLEPWSILTVNLIPMSSEEYAYIDTNNNGEQIVAWLQDNNLATATGEIGHSGFCSYPLVKLNLDEIKKYSTE